MALQIAHDVRVRVADKEIRNWERYAITSDMLELADGFEMTLAGNRATWEAVPRGAACEVFIDDVVVVRGFIDDRIFAGSRGGGSITITGRDRGGRLVDESMPLTRLTGLGIAELANAVAGRWFPGGVTLINTKNRRLLRGGGHKARVSSEPPIDTDRHALKKVAPGETRASTLLHFVREAGLVVFSTADGKQLFVGKPNYEQEVQFRFLHSDASSDGKQEADRVESLEIRESVGERYSKITVCGGSKGDSANYGANVTKRRASVDTPYPDDFPEPKELLISDDEIRNVAQAKKKAAEEMALRDATRQGLTIKAFGHGQIVRGTVATIYAIDTLARVIDEVTGTSGEYVLTRCMFTGDRNAGQRTELKAVPRGTELRV